MGIFLTLFYIATAILTPTAVFGGLAEYHIQLAIAVLTLIVSLVSAEDTDLLGMPQTYAIPAMTVCVGMSMLMGGLLGGTIIALMDFIPTAIVFFFILLNFRSRTHFQLLAGVLFMVGAFEIYQGWAAQNAGDMTSAYVLTMVNGEGERFFRTEGLGFLHDPNDFSQFLVGLIPCMFLFWRKGRTVGNLLLVYFPVLVLMFGMFLTHSRGGMVALLVIAIVLGYRKMGLIPSVIAGGLLFVAISALGWSGGREVNAESGSDRTDAWGVGMQLIRTHPIFGVGYGRFSDFYVITAHNTVMVCAAEIGLVGFFFWTLLILSSVWDVNTAARNPDAKKEKVAKDVDPSERFLSTLALEPEAMVSGVARAPARLSHAALIGYREERGASGFADFDTLGASVPEPALVAAESRLNARFDPFQPEDEAGLPEAEVRRLARVMVLCLTGILTAGWFLSRAYTMVLFIYIGLAVAVYRLAFQSGFAPRPVKFGKAAKRAAFTSSALLTMVYILLRITNLFTK